MVRILYRGHNAHWRVNSLGKHRGLIVCSREFCDTFEIKWSRFNGTVVVELSGHVGQFLSSELSPSITFWQSYSILAKYLMVKNEKIASKYLASFSEGQNKGGPGAERRPRT